MSNIPWLPQYIDYSATQDISLKDEISIPNKYDIFISRYIKYALNECQPFNFIENKNGILQTNFKLPYKTEDENFLDVKLSVESYKYIFDKFFTLGIIPEFINFRQKECFLLAQNDSIFISNILEYYLLNNTEIKVTNNKKFHVGRIELLSYRLIQEFYFLGKFEKQPDCLWLTCFNSPIEVWFIYSIQGCYLKWFKGMKQTDVDYLKEVRYEKNNMNEDLKSTIIQVNQLKNLALSTALKYTTAKLIEKHVPKISYLYTEYLKICSIQANRITKGVERSANFYRK